MGTPELKESSSKITQFPIQSENLGAVKLIGKVQDTVGEVIDVDFKNKIVFDIPALEIAETIKSHTAEIERNYLEYINLIDDFFDKRLSLMETVGFNAVRYYDYLNALANGSRKLNIDTAFVAGISVVGGSVENGKYSKDELAVYHGLIALNQSFRNCSQHIDTIFDKIKVNGYSLARLTDKYGGKLGSGQSNFLKLINILNYLRITDLEGLCPEKIGKLKQAFYGVHFTAA